MARASPRPSSFQKPGVEPWPLDAAGHFQQLLGNFPAAAYTTDSRGRLVEYNRHAAELWGREPGVGELAPPAIPDPPHAVTGPVAGTDVSIETPDGRRRAARAYMAPMTTAAGEFVGTLHVLVEEGGRERMKRPDRDPTEALRFLAEAGAELAVLTDVDSTLQRVARLAVPYFSDWCEVTVLEAGGEARRVAIHHLDPSRTLEGTEAALRFPVSAEHGALRVMRTGRSIFVPEIEDAMLVEAAFDEDQLDRLRKLRLVSYICVPMRARSGTVGALAFATAESARKYNQTDLDIAEQIARIAAIAIENASLLQRLRDADRRKDEFLAVLAHELRNPLAPVRTAVQILRARQPAPELQWAHDVIDRQVGQMARLVDDLLDVSRITTGKIELRREPVALADVVAGAVEASRPLIERRQHELVVKLPSTPITLLADAARLQQVFSNLLNNAARYTDPGGRIWISAERENDEARIEVRDNGMGVPGDQLESIFEMFSQVDRSEGHAGGGLGIGLALVKRLVEIHGGTVRAESEGFGKGSCFIVRLPIHSVAEASPPEHPERAPGAASAHRILVVDDNRDAADSMSVLLRAYGHEVRVAYDGLEAVGAAIAFDPDIVLMDIGLPKLGGEEAGRRIREARGAGLLLVAITGWGQIEDRRKTLEAGFDHHFTKPVDFEALLRLVAEAPRRGDRNPAP